VGKVVILSKKKYQELLYENEVLKEKVRSLSSRLTSLRNDMRFGEKRTYNGG
jgi:hypothetical protein